jgi:adenine-specific DNA-methyltransferase
MLLADNGTEEIVCALDGADQVRIEISGILDPRRRSELGQFMTPRSVATYMAGLFDQIPTCLSI